VFGAVRPAATMVEVSRLIAPGLLVEVEADAWVGGR
jgi:enamine deaminase RidA (YjgF/YER057c/UK114 family)